MLEVLNSAFAFLVAIILLVAIHEYGHFVAARKLGFYVEKFSIGFGPALYSWRSRDGEVEYVLAAIPLGGYVKMLGEEDLSDKKDLPAEQLARSFQLQAVWKRAVVAAAGPFANFALAVLLYAMVSWFGVLQLPSVIAHVQSGSIAERADIQVDDRILAVNGHAVHSWTSFEMQLKDAVQKPVLLSIDRQGVSLTREVRLPPAAKDPLLMDVADQLLGVNTGIEISIQSVLPDAPAARAGFKPGDQILSIDGNDIHSLRLFIEEIRSHPNQSMMINIKRDDHIFDLRLSPEKQADGSGRIGASLSARSMLEPELFREGLFDGLASGFTRTWDMTTLTVSVMGKMLTAAISPDNLGGPIAIAQLAGKTADLGIVAFLSFLALISVNLGVLNLMPVPVLDGGHLLYLGLEAIRRKPLSEQFMVYTQMIGMVLIGTLMVFAFYNDIMRLFQS